MEGKISNLNGIIRLINTIIRLINTLFGELIINPLINRLLMVHGSWLEAHGSWPRRVGQAPGAGGRAPVPVPGAGLSRSWPNRLINRLIINSPNNATDQPTNSLNLPKLYT